MFQNVEESGHGALLFFPFYSQLKGNGKIKLNLMESFHNAQRLVIKVALSLFDCDFSSHGCRANRYFRCTLFFPSSKSKVKMLFSKIVAFF